MFAADRTRSSLSSVEVHHAYVVSRLLSHPADSRHVSPRGPDAYHVDQRDGHQRRVQLAHLLRRTGATREDRVAAHGVVPARQQAHH